MFSVEEYNEDISLENEEFNSILGYSDNLHPQGLWIVSEERPVDDLLKRVGMEE